jgi:hypothetical protein
MTASRAYGSISSAWCDLSDVESQVLPDDARGDVGLAPGATGLEQCMMAALAAGPNLSDAVERRAAREEEPVGRKKRKKWVLAGLRLPGGAWR